MLSNNHLTEAEMVNLLFELSSLTDPKEKVTRLQELSGFSNIRSYVNQTNAEGDTPLMVAAESGNVQMVDFLLENGANPHYENKNSDVRTASMLAVIRGHLPVLEKLLEGGVDVNERGDFAGSPLLMEAIHFDDNPRFRFEIFNYLIEAGANVNLPNDSGRTPLMEAAFCQNNAVLELLLKRGAELDTLTEEHDMTALNYALIKRPVNEEAIKLLFIWGATLPADPSSTATPPARMSEEEFITRTLPSLTSEQKNEMCFERALKSLVYEDRSFFDSFVAVINQKSGYQSLNKSFALSSRLEKEEIFTEVCTRYHSKKLSLNPCPNDVAQIKNALFVLSLGFQKEEKYLPTSELRKDIMGGPILNALKFKDHKHFLSIDEVRLYSDVRNYHNKTARKL